MSQRYAERAATDERNMVEIVFAVGSGGSRRIETI